MENIETKPKQNTKFTGHQFFFHSVSPVRPTFVHHQSARRIMTCCDRQKQIVAALMLVICRWWQLHGGSWWDYVLMWGRTHIFVNLIKWGLAVMWY